MIEEAAYFRAQQRGFEGGDPVADWLEAESEIDRMLEGGGKTASRSLAEQVAARLREWDGEFARLTVKAREVTAGARAELERELDRLKPLRANAAAALDELRERGDQAVGDLRKLGDKVRTDLSDALESLARRLR
jgi:ABC-type transporter Mla subunit MlaD